MPLKFGSHVSAGVGLLATELFDGFCIGIICRYACKFKSVWCSSSVALQVTVPK